MRKTLLLAVGVAGAAIAALVGLGVGNPPSSSSPSGTAAPIGPAPERTAQMPPAGMHPSPASGAIAGTVTETIQVSSYTYLRLQTPAGERWAAIPRSDIAKGAHAELRDAALMRNFRSDSLDRTFDEIYFGVLASPAGLPGSAAASSATATATTGHGAAPLVDAEQVAAAEGDLARTVAEIFAQRRDLAGKQVRLRAKVAKVVVGILGRNWIHLQDGSGSEAEGNHDLVATTLAEPKVGQTVLVEALVTIDKDLGSGYRYAVLLEDATITPEP